MTPKYAQDQQISFTGNTMLPSKTPIHFPRQLVQLRTPRHRHLPRPIHLIHILKKPATRLLHKLRPLVLLILALNIEVMHVSLLRHTI